MPKEPKRTQQRRQATVIFADISGFTAMSERMDPEDVTDVMNGCFAMIERIILAHGGTIDKYIGDCVMALFGASHAIEKAARHAVEASLEIRSGLALYNEERALPIPLKVHIGVNTGLVIAGDVGGDVRKDFTVMGDTVNLAARLEDASEKGQVFVGPTTYAHTRGDFDYRELEPLSLKGKAEPVPAWEAIALRTETDLPKLGAGTRQISSELVGRERELAALRKHIERFLEGEGLVVSITGEAGIGKSRLLKELADLDLLRDACVLVGRSDSLDSRQSYHAFADALRDWADIKPEDSDERTLEKLESAAEGTLTDPGETLPFIAVILGLRPAGAMGARLEGVEGEALEKLIFKAMTDFVRDLSESSPLVLLLEDLHWADQSSVKLLESLLHAVTERQILFIQASRPNYDDTSGRVARVVAQKYGERLLDLPLEPLSQKDSASLVRNLLNIESLPHRVREIMETKGEGNPFYIEEVIRVLIDDGAIETASGRAVVTDKIHEVSIPGTVQEVIAVRFESLGEAEQELLRIASIIGRSFMDRILRPMVDGHGHEIDELIERLKERQILQERQARNTAAVRRQSLAPEREYVFRHALIQETIYSTMLKRERRDLHARVALTIEDVCEDRLVDFYGMLAFHYGQAENLEKAEDYLFRAGEEAVRSAASSEALRYFREGSRLYQLIHGDGGDPEKRFQLEKNLASALLLTGNLDEARPHYDHALTYLGERVARTPREAVRQTVKAAIRILFRMYVLRGRMAKKPASPQMQEALSLLYNRCRVESVVDPEWFLFDSMYMVGRICTVDPRTVEDAFSEWAGVALLFSYSGLSFDLSRRVSEVARPLMREEKRGELLTYHLMNFMRNYFEGLWDEPSGVDDELIEQVTRTGKVWDVDTFLGMDSEKQMDLGNFARAEMRIESISRLVTDYGYGFAETNLLAQPMYLAFARRELDVALQRVEVYEERPEELLRLIALGTKARIQIVRGEIDQATETVARAQEHAGTIDRPPPYHAGALELARVHLGVVQLETALEAGDAAGVRTVRRRANGAIKSALKVAGVMARVRTELYRHIGTHHWLLGRQGKARSWWTKSVTEGSRLGARPEVARTHMEMGRRLDGASGDEYLGLAEDAFREMGLAWDLQQIAQARESTKAA